MHMKLRETQHREKQKRALLTHDTVTSIASHAAEHDIVKADRAHIRRFKYDMNVMYILRLLNLAL